MKFSFTGPFSLSRRIADGAYAEPADLVRALATRLNAEARALADAGATFLQIDEPFLAGYPEQAALAVEAVNIVTDGVPGQLGAARLLRQQVRQAVLGRALRLPVPRRAGRARRPAGPRVRPQGP